MSSKEEFRRLMKERKETLKREKIDSPLAKYDKLGRLFCIICNLQIKGEQNWTPHLVARTHKEKLDTLKRQKQMKSCPDLSPKSGEKRSIETELRREEVPRKQLKVESKLEIIKSQEENCDKITIAQEESMEIASPVQGLPSDFFDANTKLISTLEDENKESVQTSNATAFPTTQELPKGFFDNPKEDAKFRNEIYKDPLEAEMERFKKEMEQAATTSQEILEEQLEEIQIDRDYYEVEDQLEKWAKVYDLQVKAEKIKANVNEDKKLTDQDDLDEDNIDLEDIDVFAKWRNKSTLESKK